MQRFQETDPMISVSTVHRVGAKSSSTPPPGKYPDRVSQFKNMIFANPTLNDLAGQWQMVFAWVILGLIGIGVVWDSNAVTELLVPNCQLNSDIQTSAVMLLIIVVVHVVVILICFVRMWQNEKLNFEKISFPFIMYYGAFIETQLLFKIMTLVTSGLGIASSIRTYYLLSDPSQNPAFTQASGLIFMINIVLYGFLGIFQLDKTQVVGFYKDLNIDLRFWSSSETISQTLAFSMYFVVNFMFVIHGATYPIPENCITGSVGGATALWVVGMIMLIFILLGMGYIFFNAAEPAEYDAIGWSARNFVGFASHVLFFCYILYIVLYFAAGLANVGNQVIVKR